MQNAVSAKKTFAILSTTFLTWCLVIFPASAQEATPTEQYMRGIITDVAEENLDSGYVKQTLTIEIRGGDWSGQVIQSENIFSPTTEPERQFAEGKKVVIVESANTQGTVYYVVDYYRLPSLLLLVVVFFVLAVIFAKKRGAFAIAGLAFSVLILAVVIVPKLAEGGSIALYGGGGAVLIAVVSILVAHGVNKKTLLALAGTLITVAIAGVLALLAVKVAQVFGTGSEEAYYLKFAFANTIQMKGLLLVGVLIGALGVLDDITTSLTATVEELYNAKPDLSFSELYTRGTRVGVEHIASLVNTLVLAYAGASLPLLLLFSVDFQPFWVTLNSEFLSEEVIRTLVGSTALILAVPITTVLAAYAYAKKKKQNKNY